MLAMQRAISATRLSSITIGWLVSALQETLPVKTRSVPRARPMTRMNPVACAFPMIWFVASTQIGQQTLKSPHRSRKVSSECKIDQVTGASATKKKHQNSAERISTGTSSPASACRMNLVRARAR